MSTSHSVSLEEVLEPIAGHLAVCLERGAVDVDEPEPVLVAVTELEAVHERPREVTLDVHPLPEIVIFFAWYGKALHIFFTDNCE